MQTDVVRHALRDGLRRGKAGGKPAGGEAVGHAAHDVAAIEETEVVGEAVGGQRTVVGRDFGVAGVEEEAGATPGAMLEFEATVS